MSNAPVVECVPNFSEGRNPAVIAAIASAIEAVQEVQLLNVDSSADANRTVMTFLGPPGAVLEAAYSAVDRAGRLIDMSRQSGEHPRIGAADVCPFIPWADVTMEQCVDLARELGQRVAGKLGIPVYLYGAAATRTHRRELGNIRKGEYEGLARKMQDPDWIPDFKADFNPAAGACIIGARELLLAYNVNLRSRDIDAARKIAARIRESGPPVKPARLKAVKALAWYLAQHDCTQISMNLTDTDVTPVHTVFERINREAEKYRIRVSGSEIVGMVSLKVMLESGRYYGFNGIPSFINDETVLVRNAVEALGLNDLYDFDPQNKIIEYKICA